MHSWFQQQEEENIDKMDNFGPKWNTIKFAKHLSFDCCAVKSIHETKN